MQIEWMSLFGGMVIGLAVSLMLIFNGRVTGISGILNGVLTPQKGDTLWRVLFIFGLMAGGLGLSILRPESFLSTTDTTWPRIMLAGWIVGFGTILGSGCTSGHGVCGISRMSVRSLVATFVFIAAGILTVTLLRSL